MHYGTISYVGPESRKLSFRILVEYLYSVHRVKYKYLIQNEDEHKTPFNAVNVKNMFPQSTGYKVLFRSLNVMIQLIVATIF